MKCNLPDSAMIFHTLFFFLNNTIVKGTNVYRHSYVSWKDGTMCPQPRKNLLFSKKNGIALECSLRIDSFFLIIQDSKILPFSYILCSLFWLLTGDEKYQAIKLNFKIKQICVKSNFKLKSSLTCWEIYSFVSPRVTWEDCQHSSDCTVKTEIVSSA